MKILKRFLSIKYIPIILLAILIILPATRTLFRQEYFHTHDFTHVARLAEMDRAIRDGHFPVRWSQNFGFGYGMPLFNFYGPLPFYIAWLFHLIGLSFISSIKALVILNYFISFIGMYYLTKYFWGKYGALLSATAFIYAPYRAINTYVRGSLNELTAITFVSLSLFFILMMVRKKKNKWVIYSSLSLAGIILSHNITAFISFPILFIYGLFLTSKFFKKTRIKKIKRIFSAFILSLGIASFYALPSFMEKSYTAISSITTGYFHYSQHFLYLRQLLNSPWGYGGSIFGLEDGLSFEIGKLHIVLAVIGALSLFFIKKKRTVTKSTIYASSIFIIISIFMSSFKSKFIWDNITLFQYVQFPWRFLSLIMVFSSILVGGSIEFIKSKRKYLTIPVTFSIIAIFIYLNYSHFQPKNYLDDNQALYYTDENRIQQDMSVTLPDYIHPQAPLTLIPPESRFQLVVGDQIEVVEPIINRTQEFLVDIKLKEESTFVANIFDFPGWKLFVNDQPVNYSVGADLPVIKLDLDPADFNYNNIYISGILTETPIRQLSNLISVFSLLIISYILIHERHSRSAR
jgi:hypothetical protein